MAKPRPVDDSDIVSALTLVLIFMSIMAGREIGGLYASYDEFKNLKVLFSVTEEEICPAISGTCWAARPPTWASGWP